jgi:hypothetical protein
VPRPRWHLEICITKPLPLEYEGFDTSRFEVGRVYDVNAPLCDLLVTSGYAIAHIPATPPVDGTGTPDDGAGPTRDGTSRTTANDKPRSKRRR